MRDVPVVFYACAACLSWAVANVLTKHLLGAMGPFALLSMQVSASGLAVLALAFARHGVRRTVVAWRFLFLGFLQPGLAYGLSTYALQETSASVEVLVWTLDPVLVLVMAWFFLSERPNRWLLAGLGTCAIGNLLVGIGEAQLTGFDTSIRVIGLIVAGVVASASYTVALSRYAAKEPVLPVIFWNQVGGLLVFSAAAVVAHETRSLPTAEVLGVVALSGILLHALPFVLVALLLQRLSAGSTSLMTPAVSILTLGLAYLCLGERLARIQLIGAAITGLGTLMLPLAVTRRSMDRTEGSAVDGIPSVVVPSP